MKKITVWLNALWHWLGEAQPLWIGVIGLIVAFAVVLLFRASEFSFRLAGMFLQFPGIYIVVKGIEDTRKLFGRPSIHDAFSQWIRRFPVTARRSTTLKVNLGDIVVTSGRVSGRVVASPDASVEHRIEVLEQNIALIDKRISETQGEVDQMKAKAQNDLKREEQARISEDSEIRTKLEVTETGGLSISLIGAILLFFGIILSTFPVEIAHIFQ